MLLAKDHMTKAPATIMYYSIVLRETVRITFMIAALNDLYIVHSLNDTIMLLITSVIKYSFK